MPPARQVFAVIVFALISLFACQPQPRPESHAANTYQLRGVVVEINKDKRELRVKHQDIPGYMRGMTMNFPTRDDAALATLAPGDEITADLHVAGGEYWLANVHKVAPAKPAP